MERETKFRARRADTGNWVCGYFFETPLTTENFRSNDGEDYFDSGLDRLRPCISEFDGVVYEVDPETVGEYTGLKDKNGTEIYEGDILQLTGKAKYNRRVVGFKNGIFGYTDHNYNWVSLINGFMYSPEDHGCPKVIGNKFENPELLNEIETNKG